MRSAFALFLSFILGGAAVAGPLGEGPWRFQAAGAPPYTLDPARGVQGRPAEPAAPADDCSDQTWFCLTNGLALTGLRFVAPRVCGEAKVGDVWRRGDVVVEVLRRRDPPPQRSMGPGQAPMIPADAMVQTLLLLGDPARPDIVYAYGSVAGVMGFWEQRPGTGLLLHDQAKARWLDDPGPGQAVRYYRVQPRAPLTPTNLARCRF